jgi:hypothetical protein
MQKAGTCPLHAEQKTIFVIPRSIVMEPLNTCFMLVICAVWTRPETRKRFVKKEKINQVNNDHTFLIRLPDVGLIGYSLRV